jgi:hypothetical protein
MRNSTLHPQPSLTYDINYPDSNIRRTQSDTKKNGKAYGEKKETNLSHTVRYPRAMMIKLLHTPVAR